MYTMLLQFLTIHMKGFLEFIREQGVIGLAIGVILGGSVTKLVSSLVTNIINPVLGIALGAAGDLNSYFVQIYTAKVMWGAFVNSVIDFAIVALVVYLFTRILKLDRLDKKKS